MDMFVTKSTTSANPKAELQALLTNLKTQIRDESSSLYRQSQWSQLIDSTYFKDYSDLDSINGVSQAAPNAPNQVDSPFASTEKSRSNLKWIGIGIGIAVFVYIVIMVIWIRRRRMRQKQELRANFVNI
ncbi:hypothetical protein EC988_006747 [Linderina pennispora]|nr:hypothetical protein EC988_006747 [Linderina pennispora]